MGWLLGLFKSPSNVVWLLIFIGVGYGGWKFYNTSNMVKVLEAEKVKITSKHDTQKALADTRAETIKTIEENNARLLLKEQELKALIDAKTVELGALKTELESIGGVAELTEAPIKYKVNINSLFQKQIDCAEKTSEGKSSCE